MIKKKNSILVQQWLKDLPFEELVFWANLAKKPEFEIFVRFMHAEAERRKNVIWRLPEVNPTTLAIEKAALRGGIETIHSIISMAQSASEELDRRSEDAKRKPKS